jgi:hypothetical protein
LWSARRTVTKTATVSFEGNLYEVDAALVGRRIELVYDPFDLTHMRVRYEGRDMGEAIPHRIGRHVHTKTRTQVPPPPAPTGIDYLNLVHTRHTARTADRLRYDRLPTPPDAEPAVAEPDAGEPVVAEPLRPEQLLDGELASFAALNGQHAGTDYGQLPGQLDLTTLLDADDVAHGRTP